MADKAQPIFTDEEINEQARGNSSVMPSLMIAFARECGRTPDEAAAFTGRTFAAGWDELRDQGALAIMRIMALNVAADGKMVVSLEGDMQHAEARITDPTTDEDAAFFGLSRNDVDRFNGAFGPIADNLGYRFDWRRDGDEIELTVDAV